MEQHKKLPDDTPGDKSNTATFLHSQVALEQDRLRRAMEQYLLHRTRVPSTHLFTSEDFPSSRNKSIPKLATELDVDSVDFAIVPRRAGGQPGPTAVPSWRIVLRRIGEVSPLIGLDVRGDTIIGRSDPDSEVDVNLNPMNGASYGVSRRHALLRPTRHNLYLIDLESTNGTRCNGVRLGRGTVHVVTQGDTLSFGNMTFEVTSMRNRPVGSGFLTPIR